MAKASPNWIETRELDRNKVASLNSQSNFNIYILEWKLFHFSHLILKYRFGNRKKNLFSNLYDYILECVITGSDIMIDQRVHIIINVTKCIHVLLIASERQL